MCVTDLDLEIAADEQEQAPCPGQHEIGGRYAGVAWGLAERHDDQDGAGPAEAAAEAGAGAGRSR
jgi:hypothetical protein